MGESTRIWELFIPAVKGISLKVGAPGRVHGVQRVVWLNSNQRRSVYEHARIAAQYRELAKVAARGPLAPRGLSGVCVVCRVQGASGRRIDPPNWWPTFKPIIDGLTDAGVFVDDSSVHVPRTVFEDAGRGEPGLWVCIDSITVKDSA